MQKLEIEYRNIADLQPYEKNARLHDENQIEQIMRSIDEYGFTNPILVDEHGGIIAGHGRLEASKRAKLELVPTITLAGLTEQQRRAYVIADNKIAINSRWDETLLAAELADLAGEKYDTSLTGFDEKELAQLFEPPRENYTRLIKAPHYEPTGDKPPVSKLCNKEKFEALMREIEAAEIPEDVRDFLHFAATRHIEFDFTACAEYYAHAPAEIQRLFEASALVIIDFDAAIENGFVKLSKALLELAGEDHDAK